MRVCPEALAHGPQGPPPPGSPERLGPHPRVRDPTQGHAAEDRAALPDPPQHWGPSVLVTRTTCTSARAPTPAASPCSAPGPPGAAPCREAHAQAARAGPPPGAPPVPSGSRRPSGVATPPVCHRQCPTPPPAVRPCLQGRPRRACPRLDPAPGRPARREPGNQRRDEGHLLAGAARDPGSTEAAGPSPRSSHAARAAEAPPARLASGGHGPLTSSAFLKKFY